MIKIRNFILVFICCFISILLFLSTSVQAYNLRYIANVSSDGSGGQSLTFRKYVRHYGPTYTTGWSYPGTLLSKNGGGNINGSYGTRAMVFHKSPGTTYYDSGDPDGNGNGALRVGYDFSGSEDYIDTDGELRGADNYVNKDHDILYNFANLYNIRTSHIWIKLGQGSKNDVGWGEYYKTGDLIVSKERILRESAITDFKAEGATYNNIINAIKSNEEKRGNYYETYVSGELQVKKFEDGRVYNGVASSQELIDIMMPESFQAYNNWTSSNKKINSQWSPKDFGYGSMYFSDQNVANGDSNGDIDNSRKETTQGFNTGYSVLNNFDNILKVPCEPDNSKVICVNHFDIATGNRIYSAENTSQELLDSSGNSKGQKANGLEGYDNEGGNWQELYRIQEGEWLKVRSSQKIKNGELKDSSGKQYKYYGYWKNSFDRVGNTW